MRRLICLLPMCAVLCLGGVTAPLASEMIAMRNTSVYRSLLDYTVVGTIVKGNTVNVLFCLPDGNLCKVEKPAGYARKTYLRPFTGIKPPCLDLSVVNC